jgi:hypothetical protein
LLGLLLERLLLLLSLLHPLLGRLLERLLLFLSVKDACTSGYISSRGPCGLMQMVYAGHKPRIEAHDESSPHHSAPGVVSFLGGVDGTAT